MATTVRDELVRLLRDDPEVRALVHDDLRSDLRGLTHEVQTLAEAQTKLAEAQTKLAEAQIRTERALRDLARQVGGLSDKMGGSLEDLALQTVPAVLAEAWDLRDVECERETLSVGGASYDVDLVLRGRFASGAPLVVLGEVKTRLTGREVDAFVETAKEISPALGPAEVRIVFFGFQCNHDARTRIRETGAHMVFSNGRLL